MIIIFLLIFLPKLIILIAVQRNVLCHFFFSSCFVFSAAPIPERTRLDRLRRPRCTRNKQKSTKKKKSALLGLLEAIFCCKMQSITNPFFLFSVIVEDYHLEGIYVFFTLEREFQFSTTFLQRICKINQKSTKKKRLVGIAWSNFLFVL